MQEVKMDDLNRLIEEARRAGKDVTELEAEKNRVRSVAPGPAKGERKEVQIDSSKKRVIDSTGPANEEDFK